MLLRLAKYDDAIYHYNQSLDIYKTMHGQNSLSVANMYNNLAVTMEHRGKYQDALDLHFKALGIRTK